MPGDIPVPGDYDGVGYDQLAVYRPSTGDFYVYEGAGNPAEVLSIPGIGVNSNYVPVPAEYDNIYDFANHLTYKTEPAVYDTSTGTYYISGPTGTESVTFAKGDIPTPADYLGDGEIQPAVYRPKTEQFIAWDAGTSKDVVVSTFSGLLTATVVPVAAPRSYRVATSTG